MNQSDTVSAHCKDPSELLPEGIGNWYRGKGSELILLQCSKVKSISQLPTDVNHRQNSANDWKPCVIVYSIDEIDIRGRGSTRERRRYKYQLLVLLSLFSSLLPQFIITQPHKHPQQTTS